MTSYLEWATLGRLLEQPFFLKTAALYQLESELTTPIHDSLHWSRRFEYPWVLDQIAKGGYSGETLDAGSGATALQFMLTRGGMPVTSIDMDGSAVNWVNTRGTDKFWMPSPISGSICLVDGSKPKAIHAFLPQIPFPDKHFNVSICISVLEHMPKAVVPIAIREMIKRTKKAVLITMDVCLTQNSEQLDIASLPKLLEDLGIAAVPEMPRDMLTFSVDNRNFAVLCMHLKL